METYSNLHGHMLVPQKFVAPTNSMWPSDIQGQRLGISVNTVRSNFQKGKLDSQFIEELDAIGFAWNVRDYMWTKRIFPCLTFYKNMNGSLHIPVNFTVPCELPWPRLFWNLKLGRIVHNIRTRKDFINNNPTRMKDLKDIGFVWNYFETRFNELIYPALVTYAKINGAVVIPKKFIVPSQPPWPEQCWGLSLGVLVYNIRVKGYYVRRNKLLRDELDALDFVWDEFGAQIGEMLLQSLKVYYDIHGDSLIPLDFTVPYCDPWPNRCRGLHLGVLLNIILNEEVDEVLKMLD